VSVRSVDSQDIPLRKLPDRHKKAESKENEIEANEALPGYPARVIGAEKGTVFAAYVDSTVTVNAPESPVAAPSITTGGTEATLPSTTGGAPPPPPPPPVTEEPATVDFNSNPPGADILIDGALVGNTPSIQHVEAGRHVIQLRIGGYSPWTRTMVVESGSYPSIRATLQKQ